jgi:hypothetical protein
MRTPNLAALNRLSGTSETESAGRFADDWAAQRNKWAQRETRRFRRSAAFILFPSRDRKRRYGGILSIWTKISANGIEDLSKSDYFH